MSRPHFACQLSKAELSKKCAYKKNDVEQEIPWNTKGNFVDYQPSDTMQAKDTGLPVIIDGKHLDSSENRLFCPMYWGFIPTWYQGDFREWKYPTHIARVEELTGSKVYTASLRERKRCVVVMEGYFEYKETEKELDDVYFLQSPDNKLLHAAGLFSTIITKEGETLNTCAVLTIASQNSVQQVHRRVPIFLRDENEIEAWLDLQTFDSPDAVYKIKNNKQLELKFHKTPEVGCRKRGTRASAKENVLGSANVMSNCLNSEPVQAIKRKAED